MAILLSFSSFGREEQLTEELPLGLLLHSTRLLATDELPGLFFLREPLPARTLFFFLVPRPRPPRSSFLPFFLPFFSFLVVARPDPDHGIMQRITEKSKQANDHEIHAYHPLAPYIRHSLFFVTLTSVHVRVFFSCFPYNYLSFYYFENRLVQFTLDLCAFRKWRDRDDVPRS